MTIRLTPAPPDPRRRLLSALLLGLALGVGLIWTAVVELRASAEQELATRRAVVSLQAFADLAGRAREAARAAMTPPAGSPPEEGGLIETTPEAAEASAVLLAVKLWTQDDRGTRALRVVDIDSRSLVASSDSADREGGEPPRRLRREEKPVYDLARQLRSAVEANQAQETQNEELVVEPLADGGLRLSAPLEVAGTVTGLAQVDAPPRAAPPYPGLLAALAALALPPLVFLGLWPLLRGRRWLAGAVATVLLAAGVGGYAFWQARQEAAARRAAATELAADVAAKAARAREVLARLAPDSGATATPLRPESWDTDLYRHARGELSAAGVVESKVAAAAGDAAKRVLRSSAAGALLALVSFLFAGTGAAVRGWRTLVKFRVAYAYALPALLGMLVLVFFPFFYGILLSFTNANIYNSQKPLGELWVGVSNFTDILGDFALFARGADGLTWNYHNFYWTLGFTIAWTVINVALGVSGGLILALILNTPGLALRPFYRVLFILPWAVPNYITALIWKGMFHRQFGVVNQVLQLAGLSPVSWFEHPATSFLALLATNGWLSFPFMMVISLGALQSIPGDTYEAARVDGASRWQQLRYITLPSLKPALVPAVIISMIWTFNMFNIPYLVSAGEPAGSTEILVTEAYKIAFEQYRYGYAAAYSTIIFIVLFAYGIWQNRVTKGTEAIA